MQCENELFKLHVSTENRTIKFLPNSTDQVVNGQTRIRKSQNFNISVPNLNVKIFIETKFRHCFDLLLVNGVLAFLACQTPIF